MIYFIKKHIPPLPFSSYSFSANLAVTEHGCSPETATHFLEIRNKSQNCYFNVNASPRKRTAIMIVSDTLGMGTTLETSPTAKL